MEVKITLDPVLVQPEVLKHNAVTSTFNNVFHSAWRTISAIHPKGADIQVTQIDLIKVVFLELSLKTKIYGITMTKTESLLWTAQIVNFFIPKLKDGSIFHYPTNPQNFTKEDIPEELYESMAQNFKREHMDWLYFLALTKAKVEDK